MFVFFEKERRMKRLWIYIFLILLSQSLFSQEFSNKVWLKSGAVIGFNNLDMFKYGFRDSSNFKIYFDSIDSLKTSNTLLVKMLTDKYHTLQIENIKNVILIKNFNLHRNSFNISLDIIGKILAGGISLSYIRDRKHSFDFGYSAGYTVTLYTDSVNVNYLWSVNYSYLEGKGNFKGEFGGGVSIGQVDITADAWTEDESRDSYSGLIINGTLGLRYQRSRSGLYFKTGLSPTIFTYPKIAFKLYVYLSIGFTFVP